MLFLVGSRVQSNLELDETPISVEFLGSITNALSPNKYTVKTSNHGKSKCVSFINKKEVHL